MRIITRTAMMQDATSTGVWGDEIHTHVAGMASSIDARNSCGFGACPIYVDVRFIHERIQQDSVVYPSAPSGCNAYFLFFLEQNLV
jgi:hypothetical protein